MTASSVPRSTLGQAKVGIVIPRAQTAGRKSGSHRRPSYVSPSSQSIVIDANGALLDAEDLTTLNPNCSTLPSGDLDCEIPLYPPLGQDKFVFTLWDSSAASAQAGTGNVLSTADFSFDVNGTPQPLNVEMRGVVREIALTPSEDFIPLSPSPLTVPEVVQLTVTAKDADGNVITDPSGDQANYHSPIVVKDRDTSGITTLETTTGAAAPIPGAGSAAVTVPNGATNVWVLYNGGFIRADGFDPTSADVTDPTQLQPAGLAFDCMGGTGKLPMGRSRAAVRGSDLGTGHAAAPAVRAPVAFTGARRRPAGLTGGQGGISYDGSVLSNCTYYYGYNCGMGAFAPGECVTMPVEWDTGNSSDTLEWNVSISGGELQITFNPATTGSPGTTCVSLYAPPSTVGVGDIYQINASTPWFGEQLNHPLLDVGFAVTPALQIDPSTYTTQRADC